MRQFQPHSRKQNERLITRKQGNMEDAPSFAGGVFDDLANPPSNGLKYSENYHVYGDRLEPRGGSKKWSTITLPPLVGRTGYSLSKSGTTVTKTAGTNFSAADVGNYVVHDDGAHERITAYIGATQVTVEDSAAHAASTAAWVRGPVFMLDYHEGKKKVFLQIDTRLFVAADTALSSWIQAFNVRNSYDLFPSLSDYDEMGDFLVIFNAGGIFKLDLSATGGVTSPYHYWMMNSRCSSTRVTDSATDTYQYRYWVEMSRIAGTSLTRNRTDSQVLQQSGPSEASLTTMRDYGTLSKATAIDSGVNGMTVGDLVTPVVPGGSTRIGGWTHYSLYRSLDIGANGKDAQNGVVNNKELPIWLADVPVAKAIICSQESASYTVIATAGAFSQDDVGSTIDWGDGQTRVIDRVLSSSNVSVTTAVAHASGSAAIGGGSVGTAAQAVSGSETIGKATVTKSAGPDFTASDVGRTIFWPTGITSVVVRFIDTAHVEVDINTAISSTACTWNEYNRKYFDITTDVVLRSRIAGFSMVNRFFSPLPNCNTGAVSGAFIFGAVRDTPNVVYSQIPDDMDYYGGYYNEAYQVDNMKGAIQRLSEFEDRVAVYLKNSTLYIPTNSYGTKKIDAVGEVVIITLGHYELSGDFGVNHHSSVFRVAKGRDIVINSDGGVRFCDGSKYSDNLAQDRLMTRLKKIQAPVSIHYHPLTGLLIWCSNMNNAHATLNNNAQVCYRLAIIPEQGTGWCEYTGADWVIPEIGTGVLAVADGQGFPHVLVLDRKSGFFYEISTRDGPTGSSLVKIIKDKAGTDGTGGTDIIPSIGLPIERGSEEYFLIEHKESHIYVRPSIGSTSYPNGLAFQLDIFKDGSTTSAATAVNVPRIGDITFDRKVEANQLQVRITANMGGHIITGRQQFYVAKDIAATPTNRTMSERTYQRTLGLPALWMGVRNGVLINRVTGASVTGTYAVATGPDGKADSGVSIAAALTLPSVTLVTTGALLIWHSGTIAVTIGGEAVALTSHGTVDGFTLSYAAGLTKTGAVVITPTGTVVVSDVRIFTTAIDAATRGYYFDDIDDNAGNAVMVRG